MSLKFISNQLLTNYHLKTISPNHAKFTINTLTSMPNLGLLPTTCLGQIQAGVYDFGLGRQGEKRGNWTPGEWLATVLLIMTIFLGLAVSVGLCYYITKRKARQTYGRQQLHRRQHSFQQDRLQQRNNLRDFVLVPGEANNDGKYSTGGGNSLIAQI